MRGKPFQKGNPGKPKGAQNKATKDIKEAYRLLIENNIPNLNRWLEQIAIKSPEKAIYILSDLSEYIIPKIARTELTGKDGKDLAPVILNFTEIQRNDSGEKTDTGV